MSTKKPRAKPAPMPASAKSSDMKAEAAEAQRAAVITVARPAEAARSARPAARPRTSGPAAEASPLARESLLALTTGNLAALRRQLNAAGGTRAHAGAAKDKKKLVEALDNLEAGYRELLQARK